MEIGEVFAGKLDQRRDHGIGVARERGSKPVSLPFIAPGASTFTSASLVAANNEVFCLTCHKAHGSENPFSLRWDYGARTATGTAGCRQCHNKVFTE